MAPRGGQRDALAPQIAERKALAERAGAFLKDLSGKLGARPAAALCVCAAEQEQDAVGGRGDVHYSSAAPSPSPSPSVSGFIACGQ